MQTYKYTDCLHNCITLLIQTILISSVKLQCQLNTLMNRKWRPELCAFCLLLFIFFFVSKIFSLHTPWRSQMTTLKKFAKETFSVCFCFRIDIKEQNKTYQTTATLCDKNKEKKPSQYLHENTIQCHGHRNVFALPERCFVIQLYRRFAFISRGYKIQHNFESRMNSINVFLLSY